MISQRDFPKPLSEVLATERRWHDRDTPSQQHGKAIRLTRRNPRVRRMLRYTPPMQWVFLVLALSAALVELHTGTFYLAGVALAGFITTLLGFWVRGDLLIFIFLLLCAALSAAVLLVRRRQAEGKTLPDFDVGQSVSVRTAPRHDNRLLVSYRGTNWEAVMDDGAVVAPGDTAIIAGKTDKTLHLVLPPKVAQT